jgi:spore coat polysaccharide biosynthesis protein SpsF
MIVAVLQARMSSRRLPGKVLMPLGGRPMILRQLERIGQARLDQIVVATSIDPSDDELCDTLSTAGAACVRGSLDDVLDRVYCAGVGAGAAHVVRLTADCPLIDARVIDRVVAAHLAADNDYTSNALKRSYPDGQDVEVARIGALERAWHECRDAAQREHVMPYLYEARDGFRLGNVAYEPDRSYYRVTVDYPEDLAAVNVIFDELQGQKIGFSNDDIIELLDRRPDIVELNAMHNVFMRSDGETGHSE